MKKPFAIIYLCLGVAAPALAQPVAVFDSPRHDMGAVMWHSGQTVSFNIKNSGNEPLVIKNIETSCDCTVPQWDKKPIEPGNSATITVGYNAETLGHFNKQVAVYTNAAAEPKFLTILGNVVTSVQGYTGDYQYQIGNIKLNTEEIEFDDVHRGDMPVREIEVFNAGSAPYKPELMHLPKYLSVASEPAEIRPNHGGKILVTLDSRKLHTMGLTQTSVYLSRYPGDKVGDDNELSVSAILLPEAEQMSEAELAVAPQAVIDTDAVVFPSAAGQKLRATVTITNIGKSPLLIRSLQVSSSAINVGVGRKIAPGKQTKLKITVLPKYLKRHQASRLRVLMITNDPRQPKLTVAVKFAQENNSPK